MKFIKNPFEFFIMSDYNFSLYGAIFGFFIIFLLTLKLEKSKIIKYIDGVVLSFLFVLFIGYIGAFFGGQVYGKETDLWIGVLYTHPFSTVPYEVEIFPLAIIYSVLFFILFSVLYTISILIHIRGLIGYIGLIVFASLLLIFEFFNGEVDIFKIAININLTQICSIILIPLASYQLYKISINKSINKEIKI